MVAPKKSKERKEFEARVGQDGDTEGWARVERRKKDGESEGVTINVKMGGRKKRDGDGKGHVAEDLENVVVGDV
jgi:hypothetical protein